MKKIILLLILFHHSCVFSAAKVQQTLVNSEQLIIVLAEHGNTFQGQLQRFERHSPHDPWRVVGQSIPVVIGKKGMAWDYHVKNKLDSLPIKTEGDNRTPIGIYSIGPFFGFDKKMKYKKNYIPLTDSHICVDDSKSDFYNQLIDSDKIIKKDWNSGEKMRQIPQYKWGAVIQYNREPIIKNAGSCLFIHRWKNAMTGTAGCIAMQESDLKETLNWLGSTKNPVIAIFPSEAFKAGKTRWKLPNMFMS